MAAQRAHRTNVRAPARFRKQDDPEPAGRDGSSQGQAGGVQRGKGRGRGARGARAPKRGASSQAGAIAAEEGCAALPQVAPVAKEPAVQVEVIQPAAATDSKGRPPITTDMISQLLTGWYVRGG